VPAKEKNMGEISIYLKIAVFFYLYFIRFIVGFGWRLDLIPAIPLKPE
jgi:hypothetical protein